MLHPIHLVAGSLAGRAAGAAAAAALDAAPPAAAAVLGAGALGTLGIASMAPSLQAFGPAVCRAAHPTGAALTFDDGPVPGATEALCEALGSARGTFFLLADRAAARRPGPPPRRRRPRARPARPRHDASLTVQAPARGAARLRDAAAQLEDLGGQPIRWYRPPFGATSPRLAEAVRLAGLTTVWCSVRPFDGGLAPRWWVRGRLRRVGPGDIVLLHEGLRAAALVPEAVAGLRARGLRAVTVGEVLA
ncbi:MAG: polysaccharide deacetylase family protein [Myxococcota bacterium]